MKNNSKIYILLIVLVAITVGYYAGRRGVNSVDQVAQPIAETELALKNEKVNEVKTGKNIFKFHNFHGQDLGSSGFELEYPAGWYNDGQYFSPQKITYYDITSTDAPIYYDLISEALIDTSDLKYQIMNDKRYKPDSDVMIAGKKFKKYDLLDYQSEERNRVIIFLGPKINIFESSYYLAFRFEEKPLGLTIEGSNPEIFENMVKTLKFTQ
ncbi:MAG: hypothetical protein CEO12_525 [Parcubacteria group bacterium Gr01-1014_46]|nr:MAG: hypothetical protein CEO12_525 [Parcubacteria group bacterium Gr01-1014_46]